MKRLSLVLAAAAACGHPSSPAKSDAPVVTQKDAPVFLDGMQFMDASPNVPPMVTVSGTTTSQGLNNTVPVSGATVGVYRESADTTPLATATSDANGNWTMSVPTGGQPIDGFIKSTATNYMDTYAYPTGAIVADTTGVNLNEITAGNFGLLATFAGATQDSSKGVIALEVDDMMGNPVAGATVVSVAASNPYRYDDPSNGLPSSSATATSSDGQAYMFNVPGSVAIGAMKTGVTFKSHHVNARPNAFTMTNITE